MSANQPVDQQQSTYSLRHQVFFDNIKAGNYRKVKKEIEENNVDLSYADYDKRTALHIAAAENQEGICRLLIEKQAPMNFEDRWGRIAPYCATRPSLRALFQEHNINYDLEHTYKRILDYTRSCDIKGVKVCILSGKEKATRFSDYDKRTALHIAACEGTDAHIPIIKLLLDNGASPTVRDRNGNTPIDDAKANGHTSIVQILKNGRSWRDVLHYF